MYARLAKGREEKGEKRIPIIDNPAVATWKHWWVHSGIELSRQDGGWIRSRFKDLYYSSGKRGQSRSIFFRGPPTVEKYELLLITEPRAANRGRLAWKVALKGQWVGMDRRDYKLAR